VMAATTPTGPLITRSLPICSWNWKSRTAAMVPAMIAMGLPTWTALAIRMGLPTSRAMLRARSSVRSAIPWEMASR